MGKRFGKLVCIADLGIDKYGGHSWLCLCDCGNHATKRAGVLTADNQRQMACRKCGREAIRRNRIKHGHSVGGRRDALYNAWINMRVRCRHPTKKNQYWAGKGIKVCEEWSNYPAFRTWALSAGYQDGLSIDRINQDGDYEPGNCRWVTLAQNTIYANEQRWRKHHGQ